VDDTTEASAPTSLEMVTTLRRMRESYPNRASEARRPTGNLTLGSECPHASMIIRLNYPLAAAKEGVAARPGARRRRPLSGRRAGMGNGVSTDSGTAICVRVTTC